MSYPLQDIQRKIITKLEFNDLFNDEGLYPHQEFVRRYLSPYTPYKGLLLFHTLGSGKSLICISIAVDHYLHDKKRCLVITKGSSGTDSFKKQIDMYYDMSGLGELVEGPKGFVPRLPRSEYNKIFIMDHYMALHNSIRKMSNIAIASKYSHHVLVFDEIHNARQLHPDVDAAKVYNSLEKIIKQSRDVKVLLVTATPMTNNANQLESIVRLLTDETGPDRLDGIVSYNSVIKRKPEQIYHGEKGYLANMKVYPSVMISHQRECHINEEKKGVPEDIYRTLTHISLFSFPGTQLYGRKLYTEGIMYPTKHSRRITSMTTGISKTVKYTSYQVRDEYKKWLSGKGLRKCSSKYYKLMQIISDPTLNKGPTFIFVEEVKGSGLLLLANILEAHGYELYTGDHLSTIKPGPRYTFCVGDQSLVPNMSDRLEGFNHPTNKYGEYVNILLGSRVIGESITLLNVKMFHVMTVHWNDSTVEQAIGRVIRSGSHDALPEEERKVDIYVHVALYKDGLNMLGTDLHKLDICNRKQQEISVMEKMLRKKAIDRYIHKPYTGELDPTTFIRYYMNKFERSLWEYLYKTISSTNIKIGPVPISDIIDSMGNIHPTVAMETIFRAVTNNKRIHGMYLREGNGKLHLVTDPAQPFFVIYNPNVGPLAIQSEAMMIIKPTIPRVDKKEAKDLTKCRKTEKVDILRKMHFLDRISLVEYIIGNNLDSDIEHMFKALFLTHCGTLYHIMCYRIPGDAYTAVLPIPKPKTLQNKTRVFDKGRWRYIDAFDIYSETHIVSKLEEKHDRLMGRIDRKEDMFLIISLIDNKARLRTRIFETTDKGDEDKRFVRKGRCLLSILKVDLALLFAYVAVHVAERNIRGQPNYSLSRYDKHVLMYGYNSVASMDKKMYNAFVYALDKTKSGEIVGEIESMMIDRDKYLFS